MILRGVKIMEICQNSVEKDKSVYVCEITESLFTAEETGTITVYGIKLYNRDPDCAKHKGEYCEINDISDDIEKVKELKELIEELDVYPVHLFDIVEDYLSLIK